MDFTVIWTIVDIIVAAMCLYQAGKFGAIIQIDRVDGRKTEMVFHVLYWTDIFLGLYMIIAIYGRGIERGGM